MSERVAFFARPAERVGVALPFDLDELIHGWTVVRRAMPRVIPEPFTRDEWAHVMSYVGPTSLHGAFLSAFGERTTEGPVDIVAVPREHAALWLPNNVTLLGPLVLVLLSLTGIELTVKVGTRADDLTSPWIEWVRDAAPDGPLSTWLREQVEVVAIDRDDPRNREMSERASVRIAFGSDDALDALERLPHRASSQGFAFGDRQSEAWIEPGQDTDETLHALIRVFAIFGQAGCTSPRRVALIGGDEEAGARLRARLAALWPQAVTEPAAMHVASANVAAHQLALAGGWQAELTEGNAAMVASGSPGQPIVDSVQSLFVVAGGLEEITATVAGNLQTIGYALTDPDDPEWIRIVVRSRAKRFVPVLQMHHFGPIWDGFAFWRGLFEEVRVARR